MIAEDKIEELLHQFNICIQRIADAVYNPCCAGVDTDDNGGHTAEVLVRRIKNIEANAYAKAAVIARKCYETGGNCSSVEFELLEKSRELRTKYPETPE